MTHYMPNHSELASHSTSFTITQSALGFPLQFEPALGSGELDSLIDNYISGPAPPQQKRAQVVLEFLNSIDALSYTHPVSIRYQVPQILTPQVMPGHSSIPSISASSMKVASNCVNAKAETLNTSGSSGPLKRPRQEAIPLNASSAKRLPGFSILTKEGIDITDLASRGPKTKEQRDHAALMRKLKACATCKKSKQRCDPSHHRPTRSPLSTPSSAASSSRPPKSSCISSARGSQGSISPQSSLGESFSHSPTQSFVDSAITHVGQSFPLLPTPKTSLSPEGFMVPDTLLTDTDLSALPMQSFDPETLRLVDMEPDSWGADFTSFSPMDHIDAWNSHEDIFASSFGYIAPLASQDIGSSELVSLHSPSHVILNADNGLLSQNQDRKLRRSGRIIQDTIDPNSSVADFDINQWLHSFPDWEGRSAPQTQLASANPVDILRDNPSQQGLQNSVDQRHEDYILYPESPQFDWGLEPHLISSDIGNKERTGCGGVKSAALSNRHIDASQYQLIEPLDNNRIHSYLPSPSISNRSEDNELIRASDTIISEGNDALNDTRDIIAQDSYRLRNLYKHLDYTLLDAVQQQHDESTSRGGLVDGPYNVHRTVLHADRFCEPSTAVTAVICDQLQVDSNQNARLELPRRFSFELALPDPTMDFTSDQLTQETPRNQGPLTPVMNNDNWDHVWKERNLRRASLAVHVLDGGYRASQLCFSNHDLTQPSATADETFSTFTTKARRQSECLTISSDIPKEDGFQAFSRETLMAEHSPLNQNNSQKIEISVHDALESYHTQQQSLLSAYTQFSDRELQIVHNSNKQYRTMIGSERMATVVTLCILMTLSLLSTISLLMAGNGTFSGFKSEASLRKAVFDSWDSYGFPAANSHDDVRSIPLEYDNRPQRGVAPGPTFEFPSPGMTIDYPGLENISYIQSMDSRPDLTEIEPIFVDTGFINESLSGKWKEYPKPSQSSSTYVDMPATTMFPSATKPTTSWSTDLPPKPTSNPIKSHPHLASQTRLQSCTRLSSRPGFLPALRRTWGWRFNPGPFGLRITSLAVL